MNIDVQGLPILLAQIESYSHVGENWDGYGGRPALPSSVLDIKSWFVQVSAGLALPSPMLSGDGEVSLFWAREQIYIEASFPGDGTYHFIANTSTWRAASEDIPITSTHPNQELVQLVNRFFPVDLD